MSKVTALGMDTITERSGHQMTGMAVSVRTTPAAPSPVPIPYPTMGTVAEGVIDAPMRTKINGAKALTVGGCIKACHGNEPGTLKEIVSLNTGGPCFPWLWSGRDLGQLIHGAGFRGSSIHMTVCHGGTDPPGQPGGSIAQQVANETQVTTIGCVGDSMYDHPTLPGVTIAGPRGRMTPFEPTSSPRRTG
ncbi:PAAR-like domain-containing protein [Sorangium sp. So ce296]|uniref:PAAR-like domain-containing protein n=1 Tax=Sorangium sp. So ce296 TaxID=3133296 RepID=UPI003F5F1B9D